MPLVVITGATGGIGRAAAVELSRRGAEVAIVGRDPDRVKETAGGVMHEHVADLSSLDEVRRLADELLERYERIDVLANNASAMFTSRRSCSRRCCSRACASAGRAWSPPRATLTEAARSTSTTCRA
jgi:NAD(P)-dependent dehydrogenase (short-subunit alcohol dehydrogenase family)